MKTTFLCSGYALFDGLALGDVLGDPAEPKPFRLFAVGENRLTRNGKTCTLTLSEEDVAAIADYHKAKGEKIPIEILCGMEDPMPETEAPSAENLEDLAAILRRHVGVDVSCG